MHELLTLEIRCIDVHKEHTLSILISQTYIKHTDKPCFDVLFNAHCSIILATHAEPY